MEAMEEPTKMERMEPLSASSRELGAAAYIRLNSKTNISSLHPSQPSDSLKPVPEFPIRFQDQSKVLEGLDKLYHATKHPLLDTNHMFGRGLALAPEIDDQEPTVREARQILQQHCKDRHPYIELASKRLQAVMGTNNERAFELPVHISPKPTPSPNFPPAAFNNLKRKGSAVVLAGSRFNFDSGIQVDPVTGKGLREWLIGMGNVNGSHRKQTCKSISFHDLRPGLDGSFQNVLIAHFEAAGPGQKVDVYEVQLPTTILDPETGQEKKTFEQWLWFLITKPLISLSEKDTSTVPGSTDQNTPMSSYHAPNQYLDPKPSSSLPNNGLGREGAQLRPPPNFPHPIPLSWVAFACPGANITAFPSITENSTHVYSHTSMRAKHPFLTDKQGGGSGMAIHKRKDYDFSHQGVPVFEFSGGKELFFPSLAPTPRFLSVDDIGPFHEGDLYKRRDKLDRQLRYNALNINFMKMSRNALEWERARGRFREHEWFGKFNGQWWDSFVDKAYADAGKWKWMKEAMEGGKCRVIVRWTEFEEDPASEQDTNMSIVPSEARDENGGIGLGLQIGEEENAKKKRKISSGGMAIRTARESMRSETKRRSALSNLSISTEMSMADKEAAREQAAFRAARGKADAKAPNHWESEDYPKNIQC